MSLSYLHFYKELANRLGEVGSFCPSSKDLARLMVEPGRLTPGPRRFLEVGPGTGPITREVLRIMGPHDSFTVCEINSNLMRRLQQSLQKNEHFQKHKDRVTFYEGPAQNLPQVYPDATFNVIVCSLPFSNFLPEVTEEIMTGLHDMLEEGGRFSFFEYWGMRRIGRLFSSPKQKERLYAVDSVLNKWCYTAYQRGVVRTKVSLLNLPPAKTFQFFYDEAQELPWQL